MGKFSFDSKEAGDAGKVYAVDIAPKFVEYITKTSKEQGLKNVVGVVCKPDSAELPSRDADRSLRYLAGIGAELASVRI